jgi:beta-glucosidase
MCAYNRVGGRDACERFLLNKVLKKDWGWKGFVMSDWGAVPGVEAAINGLDQQSGEQLDKGVFFTDNWPPRPRPIPSGPRASMT